MLPSLNDRLTPVAASPLPATRGVLVLAPHADDEVFGCGGTLQRLTAAGVPITVIVATDGRLGGTSGADTLNATRESESRAAARVLGYPPPIFWRLPDFGLLYGEALVAKVLDALRTVDADLVFAPSLTELHPDHQAIALATAEAVRRLGGSWRIAFYEVSAPLLPNMLIDITGVEEIKRNAMQCFPSQLASQAYDQQIAALNRYRSFTLGEGVRAAEAFFVVTAGELATGLAPLYESALARYRRVGVAIDGAEIPLVTVIVRSMDRPTLSEALASLAAQTYANVEVIVVNAKGGPHSPLPDYAGRLAMRFVDTGVALKRSPAANAGLDAARGEYVGFLDDDDTLDPDHLNELVRVLRKEGNDAIAYSAVRCVDRSDPQRNITRVLGEPFERRAKLLAGNFIPSHALLFPRQLLADGVRFDETLDVYEDWDFWLQLTERGRFVYVDRVSATYFTGGSSEVSPLAFDVQAVRRAARVLFAKWKGRVTPDELKDLGDLYHQTKAVLLGTQREVARLVDVVHETEHRLQQTENQLAEVEASLEARLTSTQADLDQTIASINELYGSTSWRITSPLRWLSTRARNALMLWRAGSAAASRAGWRHLARRSVAVGRQDGIPGVKALIERRIACGQSLPEPANRTPSTENRALPADSGKPQVLFVSHEASRTGAPIFLLNLIRHLVRELDIACTILLVHGGDLEQAFRALGPTWVLGRPEALDPILLGRLKERNIQLVYVNTISNGALQARLKPLHCPVVCHVHELAFSIEHHFGGRNLQQVLANTDLFLACSDAIRAHLQKLAPAIPVELAYPFIDVAANTRAASIGNKPLPIPAGTTVVGGCGLIGWRKGTDLFVQLAKHVLALARKPVIFVWLGGPRASEEYSRLRYEAHMLGIEKHLMFPGQVEMPASYFAQFDIFALPSREDPFPLVMLEAAALGKPIVCFEGAGGTPELVEGDAGFAVPYLDVHAMARAVVRLIDEPELRSKFGENGRRKVVERHDVQVGAMRIARVLERIMAQKTT